MILINERTLLLEITNGSERAFSTLYETYFGDLHRFVMRFVKVEEHAEDICQEVFIKIWNSRESMSEVQSFKAYLYVLAKNHSFNFLKHASVERALQDEILSHALQLTSATEEDFQNAEYLMYIEKILGQIPDRSREVYELCKENGNSYQMTAEQLGISRNAVKKHMVRTNKFLRLSVLKDFGISLSFAYIISLFLYN
ncbi:RNA polymerase sigma factor [Dyadobacter pollutisoli]|uniref:RNA polymerase sigma-70 factor n=1 Tax=Dyadobacter pollutisoli TaxID=2910158 RepID=A0A9E8NFE3_9BACT|nr:RNA polymerase sigma-70 factor [Dyadobacter pollutisoli]WAC13119.1 RNA polymerase sigma-70 factor [Dyadobacter pollutisoli]